MSEDPTLVPEDGPAGPPRSWLDTTERIAKVFAIVAIPTVIPIALAIYSAKVQSVSQTDALNRDYVQLAVSLLKEKNADVDPGIRDWAVDLLAEHSPTKFKPEVIAKLKSGAVSLPSPTSSITTRGTSPDQKTSVLVDSSGARVIDAQTGVLRSTILQPGIGALAFSTDSSLLAIEYGGHSISVYNLKTRSKIATFDANEQIYSLDFSDENKKIKVFLAGENENEPQYFDVKGNAQK
jgi:WD40 repeat protein